MPTPLNDQQIRTALSEIPGWAVSADSNTPAIKKDFKFKTFVEAWAFMTRVAALADSMDHHPDWSNSYNKVSISLSTHDSGGVTEKDIEMAKDINLY